MIKIRPFPAIIYNYDNKLYQPQKVICPPYDIITPAQAKSYRRLSCYNMIHLTLPKKASGQDKYKIAALRFRDYLEKEVFCQDRQPAIYFYQQEFNGTRFTPHLFSSSKSRVRDKGAGFRRWGFIACLGLSNSPSIYGHEHTRIEPKEDRFKLLVNVQANLEPIFTLFSDPQGFIQDIFKRYTRSNKPLIRFPDQERNINTLWRLTNPKILNQISKRMADKNLFIADGHHRYEVSLNYQDLMRKRLTSNRSYRARGRDKDWNYIMAYFCPIQSPGLVVKPVHRLVKGINSLPMDKFNQFFHIRKTTHKRLCGIMQSRTSKQRMLGMYFNKNFYIFILKNKQFLAKIDKHYRSLDIALLNHLVLNRILTVDPEDKQRVVFGANTQDLIRQADVDKTSLVFFIKPVRINNIISLARAGKKMPTKTTYFYPKVPSGLVIYKFHNS